MKSYGKISSTTSMKKSKTESLSKYLVIVESPAKCKKIEEYLGRQYKCMACFGHLRELNSLKHIDMKAHFHPTFTLIQNDIKQKQTEKIRKEIRQVNEVILATDDDREGESIAWHLCEIFDLCVEKTKRIVFHEITEQALQKAIMNPRRINMDVVHAQQARQILDLMVGFYVSPFLWKSISFNKENGLSAGRCQTPALRLVYDNQKDIESHPGVMTYDVTGYFTQHMIPFELNRTLAQEEAALDFLHECIGWEFLLHLQPVTKVHKSPPDPFSTARLQQTASNELHMSPQETMNVCQKLYEAGYITYMRTDAKKYSADFLHQANQLILSQFGETYVDATRLDALAIQDTEDNPHESIRPTQLSLGQLPESSSSSFTTREKKLYKLIWENSVESCMANATYFSVSATMEAPQQTRFVHTSEQVDFPGWQAVKKRSEEKNKMYFSLLSLANAKKEKDTTKTLVAYRKIVAKHALKQMKQHVSEARLIQLLEEKGIGRPSTFSMLLEKIQDKGYVKKDNVQGKEIRCKDLELDGRLINEVIVQRTVGQEKNKLILTALGQTVMELLETHFSPLFEYAYTKRMEDELDLIANQQKIWYSLCEECLDQIHELLAETQGLRKIQIPLDEAHVFTYGKYGPVVKRLHDNAFLPLRKDLELNVDKLKQGGYCLEDLLDLKPSEALGIFEEKEFFVKKGKYGVYVEWGEKTMSLKSFGNRPAENIRAEEVISFLSQCKESGSNILRDISPNLSVRKSQRGHYIFFKTSKMNKPVFYGLDGYEGDYLQDPLEDVKQWIQNKHHVF